LPRIFQNFTEMANKIAIQFPACHPTSWVGVMPKLRGTGFKPVWWYLSEPCYSIARQGGNGTDDGFVTNRVTENESV